jgi:hypothetical protein
MILIYIFLNLEKFRNLKLLDEIPFKKSVFLHFFGNECIIISYFQEKKTMIYQRGGDFTDVHCIIFSIFFYLVMFHESQT